MSELEASTVGEHPPPYMIFVVVFLFFLTGLLGFLVCHLLKKKGYRCRTGDMDEEEEEEEKKLGPDTDDDDEENQDTVEQILKCIIENEANMEAFNEMLGNRNVCVRHDPRLRKESLGGVPPHHHTVHSGTDHNSCHLCAQVRTKKGRRQSRTPRFKQRPGERAVFSVGRFRVTHTDKKLPGAPNPMVSSGDQLDQSQDSEERKEGGYNLRSMFKDVRPPSESSNGVVGKRRKSLTIFGLRRGSDPGGVKTGEGGGGGGGGVRFVIQQQPVVMEEVSQAEVDPERTVRPEIKPGSETAMKQTPASVKTPSPQNQKQDQDSRPAPAAEDGPSPKSIMKKPSVGSEPDARLRQESVLLPPAPSSLPILPPVTSGQTSTKMGTQEDQMADPGPLQTSTPIGPVHGSVPGFLLSAQTETYSTSSFPVTQTPPDPSSSPNLEPGFGASLALISLGSSPPSANRIKMLESSVSSLKTPTSPLAVTPSPKLSSRSSLSDGSQGGFSPQLSPSPKLPSGRVASGQSPTPLPALGRSSPLIVRTPSPALSPKLNVTPSSPDRNPSIGGSPHLTSSAVKADSISGPVSVKDPDPEGVKTSIPEAKMSGILETTDVDVKASPRLSGLPLTPSGALSPSSSVGGSSSRIGNVTIVKASPDGRRQFSVVTMMEEKMEEVEKVEEEESRAPGSETEEPGGAEASLGGQGVQEKDDMMQMEDIRDCKVTQEVKGEEEEEGGGGGGGGKSEEEEEEENVEDLQPKLYGSLNPPALLR